MNISGKASIYRMAGFFGFRSLSIFSLVGGLVVSVLVGAIVSNRLMYSREARFRADSEEVLYAMRQRVKFYIYTIEGVRAFIYSCPEISREGFSDYVKSIHLDDRYPGLSSIIYAQFVPETGEIYARYVEPNYAIANKMIDNIDLSKEELYRNITERARDSGEVVTSKRVSFLYNSGEGILIAAAVYRPGSVNNSVEERRKNVIGYIGASFRPNIFFERVVNERSYLSDVGFKVFDSGGTTIFEKASVKTGYIVPFISNGTFYIKSSLQVADQNWGFLANTYDTFHQNDYLWIVPIAVTLSGVFVSLIIFWQVWLLGNVGLRAINLSEGIAKSAWKGQQLFEAMFHGGLTPLYVVDKNYCFVAINEQAAEIMGYTASELIGRSVIDLAPIKGPKTKINLVSKYFKGDTGSLPQSQIVKQVMPNGKKIYVKLSRYPIFDHDGKLLYCMVSMKNLDKK